ncbi:MAG: hypothetical protein ACU84H_02010 [Gammaproteobacteria bacterium]
MDASSDRLAHYPDFQSSLTLLILYEIDSFLMLTHKELSGIIRQNIESRERRRGVRDCPEYNYPITDWQPGNRAGATAWRTYREINRVESYQRPLSRLLAQLRRVSQPPPKAPAPNTAPT